MADGQARFPHPNPLPQTGEGANESLRELHDNLPLAGLNIVLTRPRAQAAELAQAIERLGGRTFLFPLLEITPIADQSVLRAQLSSLYQTDLAIFISPNAVRYGVAAIQAVGTLPPSLRIATVGQGSAQALHELGISQVITPSARFDSEGLLALPELQNVAGKRVMIFRGDGGRELLGDTLKARGAMVEYVTCYVRSKVELDIGALLMCVPDAIAITSSEALLHLKQNLEAKQGDSVRGIPLFVPHARIAEAAQHFGWRQVTVTASGDDGFIASLVAWALSKRELTP